MSRKKTVTCAKCGNRDYAIYVTGCPDCGEEREVVADRMGIPPVKVITHIDFVPNRLCSACCPTGHGTRGRIAS